jgi:uncharacterized RDD family membrane protein YckC
MLYWIALAVLGFFVFAGVRLLRSPRPDMQATGGAPAPAPAATPKPHVDFEGEEGPLELVLADRSRRFVARLIDGFLVGGMSFAAVIIVSIATGGANTPGAVGRVRWITFIVGLIVYGAYEVAFLASSGQTPGKSAMKIRVVSLETATHPTAGTAFTRWLVPAISGSIVPVLVSPSYLNGTAGLPFGPPAKIAYLVTLVIYGVAFVDAQRQGLHDKVAGTIVVAQTS